jgi:hypothetical protein
LDDRVLGHQIGGNWELKQTISMAFINNASKQIGGQHKQKGRERVSLPDSTLAMKMFSRNTIENY